MAYSPSVHDRGTHVTNYSSIHSADAFVGDYQVMYTPGSTSPPIREKKRSTRFSRAASSSRPQNINHSYLLPSNMPNTSQIMPDHGSLPQVQVHYTIPADEKQIVASLRSLQHDLNTALEKIAEVTRERDEAVQELRSIRGTSKKASALPKKTQSVIVEEELFDLSRVQESPKKSPTRQASSKRVSIENKQIAKAQSSNNARVLSPIPANRVPIYSPEKRVGSRFVDNSRSQHAQHKKPIANDTEQSMEVAEDPTAASNTSRRRRGHALDENMTSAYILPDITVAQQSKPKLFVSKEAQAVIHEHNPEHMNSCEVCQRLTLKKDLKQTGKQDFTAQLTEIMRNAALEEHTIRPKIHPAQALANVKQLLTDQFEEAKRKHGLAWQKYDSILAPLSSKKHGAVGQDLGYWANKMEECRINLDQLRDVEEGMIDSEDM